MSTAKTGIEWTGRTRNPVRGCSLVSPGCTNCYAMRPEITAAEKAAAERLEAHLRPAIVAAWHRSPEAGPRAAVVAGYFDHAAEVMRVSMPSRPGRVGVGIYSRLEVLTALARAGEPELAEAFRYCEPGVIPVMLCAGSHIAMVYLHLAPADAATVGPGGDA